LTLLTSSFENLNKVFVPEQPILGNIQASHERSLTLPDGRYTLDVSMISARPLMEYACAYLEVGRGVSISGKWVKPAQGFARGGSSIALLPNSLHPSDIATCSSILFWNDAQPLQLDHTHSNDQEESKHVTIATVAACTVLKCEDGSMGAFPNGVLVSSAK